MKVTRDADALAAFREPSSSSRPTRSSRPRQDEMQTMAAQAGMDRVAKAA
jgi:hypothetical protein